MMRTGESGMNLFVRSLLATAMLLPFDAVFEEAEAAGAGTCSSYVKVMKARAAKAQALQCGFWGEFSEASSRRWCNGVKEETITDALYSDGQKIGKCEACRVYSDRANQAARDNIAFRCGFSGDRWGISSGDANDGHFQWCMALSNTTTGFGVGYLAQGSWNTTPWDTARGEEEGARNEGIKACMVNVRDRFSEREKAECEDYANTAVIMANFNANNRCGASVEGRWTLLKEPHFMWCLSKIGTNAGMAEIDSEQRFREHGAQICKGGGSLNADGSIRKGPPIRKLGKRKPQEPALNSDQVDAKPEERKKVGRSDADAPVKKNPALGRPSSSCNNAMDRLGAGCGSVPNVAPRPDNGGGSGGPSLSSSGSKPSSGGGTATPTVNVPAVPAAPRPGGIDPGIDFGGAPKQTGTKIR
jgi:hypothetical protein